jgi:dTDP-4-amino-4,6-dideoxygalactose transaminase
MLAQGAEIARLEMRLCQRLDVKHVIAVSSGSAALHLAMLVLSLPDHANVLLPSFVCTALLNAIRLVGANPVLADIGPNTWQIATQNPEPGQVHAILAPHMFGQTTDLQALEKMKVPIIEDCALALGATYRGRPVGSHGLLSVCSFYATKVICGGESGAVATCDDALAETLRDLRDYDGRKDDKLRYNYKLTDLQAAIINAQLDKLDTFISRRRELGEQYAQHLSQTHALLPDFKTGEFPFRYVVSHSKRANEIIAGFESRGVSARNPVFYPLHKVLGLDDSAYPNTTHAHNHACPFPFTPISAMRKSTTF